MAPPLKCYTNADMGLVMRDLVWYREAGRLSPQLAPLHARCVAYKYTCTGVADEECAAGERGPKMVFGVASQSDCDMMTDHPSTYRNLVCCGTDGCNLDPVPPPPKTAATPQACQVIGVKVSTAIPAIGNAGNCGDGKCYNMTALHMKDYIGLPRMVPLEPHHFSCIDGRHDDEIVATPAGDVGIFLSSVFVYINRTATPNNFTEARMKELLKDFIHTFRSKTNRFYYHTDSHSVKDVLKKLEGSSINFGPGVSNFCSPSYVPPTTAARDALVKQLIDPEVGMGCGHVKYMAKQPTEYGLPSSGSEMVKNTIKALWELKWGELRDYIHVDPLGHEHEEQAVLSITSVDGCDGFTPLITQRTPAADAHMDGSDAFLSGQIFANHDYSVKIIRNKVADYFVKKGLQNFNQSQFRSSLDNLADNIQLMKSASLLAKYRPLYTATIVGKLYVPNYWNDTVPSASLSCYEGTPHGLVLHHSDSIVNPYPLSEPLKCAQYKMMCTAEGDYCDSDEIGSWKAVFEFSNSTVCNRMAAHTDLYKDVECCSTDGCNYALVGPAFEDPGVMPQPRCQFLGVKVDLAHPHIAASSTCGPSGCYNMTRAEMKRYIGSPAMVPLEPSHFSCIDGRHDNEIVATPAGDLGIFLSNAFVYINASSTPNDFGLVRVKALLSNFITTFRTPTNRFYYHTDEENVHKLVAKLKVDGVDGAEHYSNVCDPGFVPSSDDLHKVLDYLADPDYMGCGHVKFMAKNYSQYGITSADLPKNAVRALWQLKWGELSSFINVEPLGHNHTEQAVLSITSIEGCDGFTPLITQRTDEADGPPGSDALYAEQIFVNHDYSVKTVRDKVAKYFVGMGGMSKDMTPSIFRAKVDALADGIQLMMSASLLAKNRPMYNATITGRTYIPPTRRGAKHAHVHAHAHDHAHDHAHAH